MEIQAFAGNNLNRSIGDKKSDSFVDEILIDSLTNIVLVSSNKRRIKTILCVKSKPLLLAKLKVDHLVNLLELSSIDELVSRRKSFEFYDFIILGQEPSETSTYTATSRGRVRRRQGN